MVWFQDTLIIKYKEKQRNIYQTLRGMIKIMGLYITQYADKKLKITKIIQRTDTGE